MTTEGARFDGKVALITGASDQGIGGAIAERLVREGGFAFLAGLDEPKRLLRRLGRFGDKALFVQCDVTNNGQVVAAVYACLAKFGRLDIVVNNAGVESLRPLEQLGEDECRNLFDVNLHGAVRVARAAVPHLEEGASIINITSALALGGCSAFSIYSASKAGLIGLTQSLAMELSSRRIRVVAVAPALVASPMTFKHIRNLTPEAQEQLKASHPLGTGSPHDVASAVAFLASDDARLISGITLPVGFMTQYAVPADHFMRSAEQSQSKRAA